LKLISPQKFYIGVIIFVVAARLFFGQVNTLYRKLVGQPVVSAQSTPVVQLVDNANLTFVAAPKSDGRALFRSASHGYSVRVPRNWKATPAAAESDGIPVDYLFADTIEDFTVNINFVAQPTDDGKPGLSIQLSDIQDLNDQGIKAVALGTVHLGLGQDVRMISFPHQQKVGNKDMQLLAANVQFGTDHRQWIATLSTPIESGVAPEATQARYLPAFKDVLASFQLTNN
jgi:hypothetical protein